MRRLPPLNALRAFEATARLGSAQQASEELHVTHGAISRQLSQLEAWLGLTLFDRSQRRLQLNRAGRDYLAGIGAALDQIDQTTRQVRHARQENVLGLATTHSIASKWLMDKLPDFYHQHPEIELWLSLEQGLTDFGNTRIDAGLRMGQGPWPDLECLPLMDDALITVCSPTLLSPAKSLAMPSDIADFTLLHDQDPETRWQRWFNEYCPSLANSQAGPRYASSDMLIGAAIAGQGIALVSRVLARADLQAGRLIQPLPQAIELGSYFWLVWPRDTSPHTATLGDWLQGVADT